MSCRHTQKLGSRNFKLPHILAFLYQKSQTLNYVLEHCLLEYKKQKVDFKPWVILFILFPFALVTGGNFC